METGTDVRTPEFMLDYLDTAVVGLHWVDGDTITVWANKADYEPLGYTEEEYVGHSITEFHADPDVIADILQRLLAGEETLHDNGGPLRGGGIAPILPLPPAGRVVDDRNACPPRNVATHRPKRLQT